MPLNPICEHTRALVHTGPNLQWWLSLDATAQGAWAAAIGSFAAVFIAIVLSTRDFRERQRQRTFDARALASYLRTDVTTIFQHIPSILTYLEGLRDQKIGQTSDDLNWLRNRADQLFDSKNLESKVDLFGVLPGNIGEQLAAATGSLQRGKAALHFVADNIRTTPPAKYEELTSYASEVLVKLKVELRPMVDFCTLVERTTPFNGFFERLIAYLHH